MIRVLVLILILFAVIVAGYYFLNKPSPIEEDFSSIDTLQDPLQSALWTNEPIIITKKNLQLKLTPQATYKIGAIILSTKKYGSDWSSQISPYDLALGWGGVSRQENLDHIKFKQVLRWYRYRYDAQCLISQDYISKHSSNHHIISANSNIAKAIKFIRKKDIIELEGKLVNVKGMYKGKSVHWNTSTTRDDTGNGSCEILYVTKIKIGHNIYR
jgi:hypothetical protein